MAFVDTNIMLRWLLGDHATLSPKAESLISSAKVSSLTVTDVVLAEIVYVLRAQGYDRAQTCEAVYLTFRVPALAYENPECTAQILDHYAKTSLDFADCYLLARANRQHTQLHTFDKKLAKHVRA